jgi:hypothetical protein
MIYAVSHQPIYLSYFVQRRDLDAALFFVVEIAEYLGPT